MLHQIHILDITAANLVLQNAYLANVLVNFQGLSHTFYEIDLLLEHQKGKLKHFLANRSSSM